VIDDAQLRRLHARPAARSGVIHAETAAR
jgi:hypothetical protein